MKWKGTRLSRYMMLPALCLGWQYAAAQYTLDWANTKDIPGIARHMIVTTDGGIVICGSKTISAPPAGDLVGAKRAPATGKAGGAKSPVVAKPVAVQKELDTLSMSDTSDYNVEEAATMSPTLDDQAAANTDMWIAKFNADGKKQWEKFMGGKGMDIANGIIQTSDGGYAVAGTTSSRGAGKTDAWVMKLDASGSVQWDTVFGGKKNDGANAIIETSDHGLAVAGYNESKGHGETDCWMIRLTADGKRKWDVVDGGGKADMAYGLAEGPDKSIIMVGYSFSAYGYGGKDAYLVKVDTAGVIRWDKVRGGDKNDEAYAIRFTSDDNFTIFGLNRSRKDYPSGWLIKLSADGKKWGDEYIFPTGRLNMHDPVECHDFVETADKGYLITGKGYAYRKRNDLLLIKLTPGGELDNFVTYGYAGDDEGNAVVEMPDKSVMIAGTSGGKGTLLKFRPGQQ